MFKSIYVKFTPAGLLPTHAWQQRPTMPIMLVRWMVSHLLATCHGFQRLWALARSAEPLQDAQRTHQSTTRESAAEERVDRLDPVDHAQLFALLFSAR